MGLSLFNLSSGGVKMIIFRTKPASILFEGITIFPGVQFMHDEKFDYLKNKYPDFANETKGSHRAAIQILVKPSECVVDQKTKAKTWPKAKKNIGEEIKSLDVEAATSIIEDIIDEEELSEVQTLDIRREIQAACKKQWELRAQAMARLAPRTVVSPDHSVASKPIFSTDDPLVKEVVSEMASSRSASPV